ncbi:alpha/beta fold hydrolase [Antrihabitans sp. YC2-6]|uniref:alpha/beta fold hydrolase n=1 Tax=Antrihabitans sp. YC2-6 TaxID=2799498 RepID=UPI0018F5EADC|nr:alpha/beta hydrolase [Antrihabitans sp. YC2-6]MBJ8345651.1 alpha/beta fold hydrolase [Antrihabitans sp. YC2-6]
MTAAARSVFVLTNLGSLHVQDAGPSGGLVALLWPSLFSDGETSWGAQLAGLHSRGWRTVLVDPPGTGSSRPSPRRFTMEECAEAALDILDALEVERAAILGLSWGGFVALRVALAAPQRVTALVLSNTSARGMSFAERQRDRLNSALVRVGVPGGPGRLVVAGMLSAHTRRIHPGFVADMATKVNDLDAAGLSRAMRSVLVERGTVVDDLDQITAPTLVIAGADDKALPARPHSEELANGIAGAKLAVLERVAHLAPREAPTRVAALLTEFLSRDGGIERPQEGSTLC